MTHNQVNYWNMLNDKTIREESNRISMKQAEAAERNSLTNEFSAKREEYWTHKQHNWNESMFGYQLFTDMIDYMSIVGALF